LYETLESLQQQFAASTALATPEQAFEPDWHLLGNKLII
jgi:hypothetical protein